MRAAAIMLMISIGCSSKAPIPESLVDRWASAIGGRPALAALATIHVEGSFVMQGIAGRVETWETATGSVRQTTELGGAREIVVRDGKRGWVVDPSGAVREGEVIAATDRDAAYRNTVATLLGTPDVKQVSDTTLEVIEGTRTITIVIDRESGLPRTISQPVGHEQRSIELGDWRVVEGVKFPFVLRVSYDGREESVTTIDRITRAEPPAGTFARPPDPIDTTLARGSVEIPIEIAKNTMYIRASINDGVEERFILDTGATTILDDKRAAALGLASAGAVSMSSIRGQSTFRFVRGATFRMPGVTLRDLTVHAGDVEAAFGLGDAAGLIGYEVFARLFVEIDFARSIVRLGDTTTPRPDRARAIRFTWAGTTPLIETTLELADGTQQLAKFMLDTGCACEIFASRPFAAAKLRDTSVVTIRIGAHRIEKPSVVIPRRPGLMDDPTTAGYLGLVFLQRFRVALDYQAQLLWLEPR